KETLDAVLLDPEEIKNVRAAFDAYIFLSYRKKDRRYVNELRRLIHSVPECRDIAIWYDDYIVVGESFTDSIERAMKKSKIFTLLVTPSVLERNDGKPNYVMEPEYRDARDAKMEIFPVEMQETDKAALESEFRDIPKCTGIDDKDAFKEGLLLSVRRAAITRSPDSPEHDFFIGLAYLEGIDVERNIELATELLASAANAGIEVAIKKLIDHYLEFMDPKATEWARRLVDLCAERYGKASDEAIDAMDKLAYAVMRDQDREQYISIYLQRYELRRDSLGDKDEKTLLALCELVENEGWLLTPQGKDHSEHLQELLSDSSLITPKIVTAIGDIVSAYDSADDEGSALRWARFLYNYQVEMHGADSPEAIAAKDKVAYYRQSCGSFEGALDERTELYYQKARLFGKDSREALSARLDIIDVYLDAVHPDDEKHTAARNIASELCDSCSALLGKDDKLYIYALRRLARANAKLKLYHEAQEKYEEIYRWYKKHVTDKGSTADLLDELARVCLHSDRKAAREYLKEQCELLNSVDTSEDEDISAYDMSEKLSENRRSLGIALKMLADLNADEKNYAAAIECLRYYLPIAETEFWYEPELADAARAKMEELKKIIGQ
ncbi:MAG: toll/interleukin-1 receptor domain-containing protein, partial [Clostridia bacterium]|nr:toll/interleukin-1 receptor domain-containing protein [Clostridia bacterium]